MYYYFLLSSEDNNHIHSLFAHAINKVLHTQCNGLLLFQIQNFFQFLVRSIQVIDIELLLIDRGHCRL